MIKTSEQHSSCGCVAGSAAPCSGRAGCGNGARRGEGAAASSDPGEEAAVQAGSGGTGKPRNHRHLETIGAGRKRDSDAFSDINSVVLGAEGNSVSCT